MSNKSGIGHEILPDYLLRNALSEREGGRVVRVTASQAVCAVIITHGTTGAPLGWGGPQPFCGFKSLKM